MSTCGLFLELPMAWVGLKDWGVGPGAVFLLVALVSIVLGGLLIWWSMRFWSRRAATVQPEAERQTDDPVPPN
jgi:hypothetical protein